MWTMMLYYQNAYGEIYFMIKYAPYIHILYVRALRVIPRRLHSLQFGFTTHIVQFLWICQLYNVYFSYYFTLNLTTQKSIIIHVDSNSSNTQKKLEQSHLLELSLLT